MNVPRARRFPYKPIQRARFGAWNYATTGGSGARIVATTGGGRGNAGTVTVEGAHNAWLALDGSTQVSCNVANCSLCKRSG